MDDMSNPLGAFLRARRELVTPEQAGIPSDGVRRVPGLRREEVAMLAGISADYYLRLERGRDRSPSAQVLESIARVLQLDDEHLEHLLALVAETPRRRRRRTRREAVPTSVLSMLHSLVQPAFVEDRYFDILATNRLAHTLSPGLTVGRNQLRDLFLDSAEQARYPDWLGMTECFVASYRQAIGTDIDDPHFIELTGEISLASPRFRELWARHDVRAARGALIRFDHPQVGALTLNREAMTIGGTGGLMLVVYHPDRGSADEEKLTLLASAGLPSAEVDAAARPGSPPARLRADRLTEQG
jgi:transcriptional regulator with XRE-family HTH domain